MEPGGGLGEGDGDGLGDGEGEALFTLTVTVEVPVFPAASRAVAVMACEPLAREVVSSDLAQLVVPVAVWGVPLSTATTTLETEALSEAEPDTWTAPATVAPCAGVEMDTDGGVVSAHAL